MNAMGAGLGRSALKLRDGGQARRHRMVCNRGHMDSAYYAEIKEEKKRELSFTHYDLAFGLIAMPTSVIFFFFFSLDSNFYFPPRQ
jgi:hypothetical protein